MLCVMIMSISKQVDYEERSPKERNLAPYDIFLCPIARLVNFFELFPIDLHSDAISETK